MRGPPDVRVAPLPIVAGGFSVPDSPPTSIAARSPVASSAARAMDGRREVITMLRPPARLRARRIAVAPWQGRR